LRDVAGNDSNTLEDRFTGHGTFYSR
jgi:hypothetical protein